MLVGRRLDMLTPEERDTWFGWIDAGPDMSDFDESFKRSHDRDATDEDREARIRYWQFEKLHWVREHLAGKRRKTYRDMLAEHGNPDLADLNIHSGSVRWGHLSAMTADDLARMDFQDAVNAVSSSSGFRIGPFLHVAPRD